MPSGFLVYVHYPTSVETQSEQYFLLNLASVVSSVGGGLGLFLGFSCLALATKLIDAVVSKTAGVGDIKIKEEDDCSKVAADPQVH